MKRFKTKKAKERHSVLLYRCRAKKEHVWQKKRHLMWRFIKYRGCKGVRLDHKLKYPAMIKLFVLLKHIL